MFSRKANLDSHLKHVHTNERNFKCDICGLKVKTKGILRNHQKIHSTNPEDLLPCEVCGRKFKTQNQLINHKVRRSDNKPKQRLSRSVLFLDLPLKHQKIQMRILPCRIQEIEGAYITHRGKSQRRSSPQVPLVREDFQQQQQLS